MPALTPAVELKGRAFPEGVSELVTSEIVSNGASAVVEPAKTCRALARRAACAALIEGGVGDNVAKASESVRSRR